MIELVETTHILCCIISFIGLCSANSVFLYKPYGQIGQTVTSSTLAWEQFLEHDERQQAYAVNGGKYISELEGYAVFVCRVQIEGVYTAGYTKKELNGIMCISSMHHNVISRKSFEILINKGGGGKLTWQHWSKFTGGTPQGAIVEGFGHPGENYVARHRIKHSDSSEHRHHSGNDNIVGSFDPNKKLAGRIVVAFNGDTQEYDEGEILVESEPVRYELKGIKYDKLRTRINRNTTTLGFTILSNDDLMSNSVETVISYEFDKEVYWGTHEAVSRGLNTTVFESTKYSSQIEWGLPIKEKVINTKTVNTILQPETALNVTMKGNYTQIEAPYTATLISYYADDSEPVARNISSYLLKRDMLDVKIEYSPVYFIKNNTLVPTTTTTTTSTTSTTEPTTTSTKEPSPLPETPMFEVTDNEIIQESRETLDHSMEKVQEQELSPKSGSISNSKLLNVISIISLLHTIFVILI